MFFKSVSLLIKKITKKDRICVTLNRFDVVSLKICSSASKVSPKDSVMFLDVSL